MTTILSHRCTVDSRCATNTDVRPCASSCTTHSTCSPYFVQQRLEAKTEHGALAIQEDRQDVPRVVEPGHNAKEQAFRAAHLQRSHDAALGGCVQSRGGLIADQQAWSAQEC